MDLGDRLEGAVKPVVGGAWSIVALACAACGRANGGAAQATLIDAVWCDVGAVPCVDLGVADSGLPGSCATFGNAPVPAAPPGGNRVCFDHTAMSPQAACAAACSNGALDPALFSRAGCAATVDTDGALHKGLNAQGFRPSACTGASNDERAILSGAGTNTVAVTGTGTATYGGATANVTVISGRIDIAAPNTSCTGEQATCPVQLDQVELYFDGISVGGLAWDGLGIFLDGPLLSSYGYTIAPHPPSLPDPEFEFMTATPTYDVIGDLTLNGARVTEGFSFDDLQVANGALNLTTGALSFEFQMNGVAVGGQPLTMGVLLTTSAVIDAPPVITVAAPMPIVADSSCTAQATLAASVSSPVGLPVTLTYAVDKGATVFHGPTVVVTLDGVGSHVVAILATDSLGATTRTSETLTVTGPTSCP